MFKKLVVKKAFELFPAIEHEVDKIIDILPGAKIIHKKQKDEDTIIVTGMYEDVFIIGFQGTVNKDDVIDDLETYKKHHFTIGGKEVGDIHFGFYKQYKLLHNDVIKEVMDLPLTVDTIYIIGHSLGGALSLLHTLMLKELFPRFKLYNITIGCPRVGNKKFVRQFENIPALRFVHRYDDIPSVPPMWLSFKHICPAIYLPCVNPRKRSWVDMLLVKIFGSFHDHSAKLYNISFNGELEKGRFDSIMN